MTKSYIEYEVLPNGNLVFRASNEARHDYAQQFRERGSTDIFYEVIGSFQENGELFPIEPEWIGALTDAPIVGDIVDCYPPEGQPHVCEDSKVWWFPDYQITDPMAELFHKGRVEFTLAT